MTTIPTECEVALLRLRASTYCTKCDDCERVAVKLRATADQDAKRCRVQLTQLTQRELALLCTDAYHAAQSARTNHQTNALEAAATLSFIYKRLRDLLDRAITPSANAQEWLALHIDGETEPGELSREITASDCTLGRLEP